MRDETRAMALLKQGDPAPNHIEGPALDAFAYLDTIKSRSSDMTQTQIDPTPTTRDRTSRTWIAVAAVAAAVILIGTTGLFGGRDTAADPSADPLAAVDAFFDAVDEGDEGAALDALAPDLLASDNFSALIDYRSELVGLVAEGGTYGSPDCTLGAADGSPEVICTHMTSNAVILAVGAAGVPTTTTLTVGDIGITSIHLEYGNPDFTVTGLEFRSWLQRERPDVECVSFYVGTPSCVDPVTHEDFRQQAERVARYAEEWAAYLDERGCDYDEGC